MSELTHAATVVGFKRGGDHAPIIEWECDVPVTMGAKLYFAALSRPEAKVTDLSPLAVSSEYVRVHGQDTDRWVRLGAAEQAINNARPEPDWEAALERATDRIVAGRDDERELIRRLYVELLWCDRQLTGKRVKQGQAVRNALADGLAYLQRNPALTAALCTNNQE